MNELLQKVIEAHGGLDRWSACTTLKATIVAGGEFWGMKGLEQDQNPRELTVWLHEQHSMLSAFGDPDWHLNFKTKYVAVEKGDGSLVADRNNPRAAFADHVLETPWDALHLAYFDGYALRTYLTTPFLLTMDGVQVSEIEPWQEANETWRVLRAEFPEDIETHGAVQDFFFGEDLLLRRHDYPMDVAGGFYAAHLVYDYIEADGIRLPTRRRAYTRGSDRRPVIDPLMVSIDISDVHFA